MTNQMPGDPGEIEQVRLFGHGLLDAVFSKIPRARPVGCLLYTSDAADE